MAAKKCALAYLVILLCFSVVSASASASVPAKLDDDEYSCVYTIYVRTSSTFNAGTDSIISAAFYDETGDGILIRDLVAWGGTMEEGHDYYERGNLDIFTGRGPCLSRPICAMELSSDGSGPHHGWYCNYVEITSTGPHIKCAQQQFTVEQWLALDRSPHELSAVRNYCSDQTTLGRRPPRIVTAAHPSSSSITTAI